MEHLIIDDGKNSYNGMKKNWKKLRKFFSKASLTIFFVLYTLAGAKIFQLLEHPSEVERYSEGYLLLTEARTKFLTSLVNISNHEADIYLNKVSEHLKHYEKALVKAEKIGLSLLEPKIHHYQWNFIESIFFASTIITTIGFGNMAPVTTNGRVFCILYGFIGIPVALTVIADLGTFFANMVLAIYEKFKNCFGPDSFMQSKKKSPISDKTKRGLIAIGGVLALLMYLSVGARLFITWEDWTFFEAFYFCFITMTTIGLGDLVPEKTEFMLVCTLYILIGLALTSTIIELIRRQYAESWEQMKALSGKLGELSGPLADQLKKLGQHDLNLDLHLNSDFKDLMNIIQLHRLETFYKLDPKWRTDKNLAQILNMNKEETESIEQVEKKKVIQIVIYESSV